MTTIIEQLFPADLIEINGGGYGFMGKDAKDMNRNELLIYVKYAVDKMNVYLQDIYELEKKRFDYVTS